MIIRSSVLAMAVFASLPVGAQSPAAEAPSTTPAATSAAPAALTPERLQAIRQALLARIAVYDAAEQAMRRPTPAELAALNPQLPSRGASRVVTLRSGGLALRGDAAQASFLVVDLQPDGKAVIRHAESPKALATRIPAANPSATASTATEGGRHAQ
jgi:hypothetical protein